MIENQLFILTFRLSMLTNDKLMSGAKNEHLVIIYFLKLFFYIDRPMAVKDLSISHVFACEINWIVLFIQVKR